MLWLCGDRWWGKIAVGHDGSQTDSERLEGAAYNSMQEGMRGRWTIGS